MNFKKLPQCYIVFSSYQRNWYSVQNSNLFNTVCYDTTVHCFFFIKPPWKVSLIRQSAIYIWDIIWQKAYYDASRAISVFSWIILFKKGGKIKKLKGDNYRKKKEIGKDAASDQPNRLKMWFQSNPNRITKS